MLRTVSNHNSQIDEYLFIFNVKEGWIENLILYLQYQEICLKRDVI